MRARFLPLIAFGTAVGCGDSAKPNDLVIGGLPPSGSFLVQVFAGNGQTGVAGTVLTDSIVVRVITTTGTPVSGIQVRFASLVPGAVMSPVDTRTGANGTARASWQLGLELGQQTATAIVAQITNPVVFTATGVAPPAGALARPGDISGRAPRPLRPIAPRAVVR